jgi:superfamily II DNA or RNA helicase
VIDIRDAGQLLDFSARIGPGQRAQEQLEGAVALHNLLSERNVAYLADEVGMGKTYVALGAMALFRHHDPSFRVMVLAPRENIQAKWIKELGKISRPSREGPGRPAGASGGVLQEPAGARPRGRRRFQPRLLREVG